MNDLNSLGDEFEDDFLSGDEFFDDDDDYTDDDLDFLEDDFGFSLLDQSSPYILIPRRNPFGRLQLPPRKCLRPGFQDVEQAMGSSAPVGGPSATQASASSASNARGNVASGKSPKRMRLDESKRKGGEAAHGNIGNTTMHDTCRTDGLGKPGPSVDPIVQTGSSAVTSSGDANAQGISVTERLDRHVFDQNEVRSEAPVAETQLDEAEIPVPKIGEKKARKLCDLDAFESLLDSSAPAPPKLAFQWFCEDCPDGLKFADCVKRWREHSDEERARYSEMADKDRARFQKEYEWRQSCGNQALPCAEVLEQRAKHLEKRITEAELRPRRKRPQQDETQLEESEPASQAKKSKRRKGESVPKETPSSSSKRTSKKALGQREGNCESALKVKNAPRQRDRKPKGYPDKPLTAYAIFCQKRKLRLAEASTLEATPETCRDTMERNPEASGAASSVVDDSSKAAPETSQAATQRDAETSIVEDGASQTKPPKSRGASVLKEYRAAWNALSEEEKSEYTSLAAQDDQRFQGELEVWLSQQEDGGLGTEAARIALKTSKKKVTKPIPPAPKRSSINAEVDKNSMDAVLLGAAALKRPLDAEAVSSSLPALAEPGGASRSSSSQGYWESSTLNSTLLAQANDTDGEDLFAGFGNTDGDDLFADIQEEPGNTNANEFSSPALPLPTPQGSHSSDALPTPSGVPATFGPAIAENDRVVPENDRFHDWMFGENDLLPREEVPVSDEFALAPFQSNEDLAWSDMLPRSGGAGSGGALQLQFDADGNTIIDPSSTQVCMDDEPGPVNMGEVNEAVKSYEAAYPRTKATKWTETDTDRFYEALSIYGTDLFLVQTFFRDKSAAQIKTKFGKEMKKHPQEVQRALTTQARKLTKEAFEKQHGKIDTSQHYVPPTTPEPGEEPEPEIGETEGFPEPLFPPEPDCTEEDEADTTNRLMALFD